MLDAAMTAIQNPESGLIPINFSYLIVPNGVDTDPEAQGKLDQRLRFKRENFGILYTIDSTGNENNHLYTPGCDPGAGLRR
jgi:hypothetical protein